jgi:hypothetical protein
MNFRERIGNTDSFKITDNGINYNSNEDIMVMSFFQRDEEAEKILRRILIGNKNVILLSRKDVDNNLLCFYVRKFISKNESVEILQNVKDDVEFVSASKVIIPNPSIQDVIKLFELILCDYKTFIWTMNVKSFGKIIETLETLILLNTNNLTQQNARHLIGSSDSCLVYFDTDETGIYYISDIATIEYDEDVKLKTLFSKYEEIDDDIEEENKTVSEDIVTVNNSADSVLYDSQNKDVKTQEDKQDSLNDELIDSAIQLIKSMDKEPVIHSEKEAVQQDIIETEDEDSSNNTIVEEKIEEEQVDNNSADGIVEQTDDEDLEVDVTPSEVVIDLEEEVLPSEENIRPDDIAEDKDIVIEENTTKKINKYKQLKEKIKMRKFSEQ